MSQRSVCRVVVAVLFLCSLTFAGPRRSSSSSSHRTKASSSEKTVHVRGYTRKDGKYVAPHDRRAPGTATYTSSSSSSGSYRHGYVANGYTASSTVQRDKHGRIKRSSSAKNEFKHDHPCPATGKSSGRCPGYVIDHVNPLECGGADAPSNMQWQTIADGKAKDKTEGNCRIR